MTFEGNSGPCSEVKMEDVHHRDPEDRRVNRRTGET